MDNLKYHLTYNVIDDCWIPMTLTAEEGYRSNIMAGGKTALMLTVNGYLLAFDPNKAASAIEDKDRNRVRTAERSQLFQNYPNPFNPKTMINYELAIMNDVELSIYNLLGQKVATLVDKRQNAGSYSVEWDATGFASGIYLYRIKTDIGYIETKKLILLK